ncbi:MAG: hypothetical protein JNN00_13695 [Chitinophagaceae bacterium]|nr:hypothetical protein [Chitinophagaceae bacterium]
MPRKLTDLIRENKYLKNQPPDKACRLVHLLLARIIKDFEFRFLADYKVVKLSFFHVNSAEDVYVSRYEVPDRQKCTNLIRLIQVVLMEDADVHHTDKWPTIRDFWYRVQNRPITGHSDVEKVLDPIARLDRNVNLFNLLRNVSEREWNELEKWDEELSRGAGEVKKRRIKRPPGRI